MPLDLDALEAAVANVGRTDYRSGLKSLTATLRYVKPLADARDGKVLVDGINNLPALIALARLAERMAEALHDLVDATEHTYCSPTPEGHIAGESIRRVRDKASAVLREWDALEKGDET